MSGPGVRCWSAASRALVSKSVSTRHGDTVNVEVSELVVAQSTWVANRVVLMAVKSQHTVAALLELADVVPSETAIVCLQNGIANEPAALRTFPNVYGVSVACPTSHLQPGVVQAWSTPVTGLLDIGRYPTGSDEVSEAVAATHPQLVDTMGRYLQQIACVLRPGSINGADLALRSFAAFVADAGAGALRGGHAAWDLVRSERAWGGARNICGQVDPGTPRPV